jgi:putative endonuclease
MYILECSNGSYYTGSTKDLKKRLWEHENGLGANHTKKYGPVTLVYFEKYVRVDDAFYREKQVQGWTHAKKKAMIEKNAIDIRALAECQNETSHKNAGFGAT